MEFETQTFDVANGLFYTSLFKTFHIIVLISKNIPIMKDLLFK